MKKTILLLAFSVISALASAQTIKSHGADVNDYIKLLNGAGYQAYCFTVPQEYAGRWASFGVREYRDGKELPAEDQKLNVMLEGFSFDNGSPEVMIGFLPTANGDTTRVVSMNWGASVGMPFPMVYKITDESSFDNDGFREPYTFYGTVANDEEVVVKPGEFVPLCLFGSAYKVVQDGITVYKFCGSYKDLVESSPHFYLIGITIH